MNSVCDAESKSKEGSATQTETKPKLAKKKLGSIRPLTAYGDLWMAGQPQQSDIQLLKQQGIKTVVTLRKPGEVPWDQQAAYKQAGIKFMTIPFQKPEELTPEVFGKVRKLLNDKQRGPTLLHCGSSNRVAAVWYAHRVLDGKLSADEAATEAKIVGIRSQALLEKAKQYVASEQAKQSRPATEGSAAR